MSRAQRMRAKERDAARGLPFENRARRRAILYAREHGWLCYWCGRDLTPETITAEHIVERANGGKTADGNVVPSCGKCNHRRPAALAPSDWQAVRTLARSRSLPLKQALIAVFGLAAGAAEEPHPR